MMWTNISAIKGAIYLKNKTKLFAQKVNHNSQSMNTCAKVI